MKNREKDIYEKWGLSAKMVGPQMCGKSLAKSESEKGKCQKRVLRKGGKHERIMMIYFVPRGSVLRQPCYGQLKLQFLTQKRN